MNAFVQIVSAIFVVMLASFGALFLSTVLLALPFFIKSQSWILAALSFCSWVIIVDWVRKNLIPHITEKETL